MTAAEGFILGVGAKMFTSADAVVAYGAAIGMAYDLIYWITTVL